MSSKRFVTTHLWNLQGIENLLSKERREIGRHRNTHRFRYYIAIGVRVTKYLELTLLQPLQS